MEISLQEWFGQMEENPIKSRKGAIFRNYSSFQVHLHELRRDHWLATISFNHFSQSFFVDDFFVELEQIMREFAEIQEIKVVIFTGEEKGLLPVPIDLKHEVDQWIQYGERVHYFYQMVEKWDKPVIAAVHRGAFGHACELLGAVHLVVSDQDALFTTMSVEQKPISVAGGTQRLPRLSQAKRGKQGLIGAIQLLAQGNVVSAEEAWRIGLVDEISPEADALQYAISLAKEYMMTHQGLLHRSFVRRRAWMQDWELKKSFPSEVVEKFNFDEYEQEQMQLIRQGFEQGFTKGLQKEQEWLRLRDFQLESKGCTLEEVKFPRIRKQTFLNLDQTQLIPMGKPFYPRFTVIPPWQVGYELQLVSGTVDRYQWMKQLIPVEKPKALEVLLYMLASEVNDHDLSQLRLTQGMKGKHGQVGMGLVVAIGEEVKREGVVNVGELVTVNLQIQPVTPLRNGTERRLKSNPPRFEQGTHQQFTIAHVTQLTRGNGLWEGYWDRKELNVELIRLNELEENEKFVLKRNVDEQDGVFVIQHALPRLNIKNSDELYRSWSMES
ncbi:enoyl-CoA hydratase/isomerase family protein [Hazenella coriacea]|uniref:Enoyl-CoA hydratase/isomerase-like protein n=1 Tax=Hazenella coriacea TaxID=1179467 RepID=A0A4R3L8S9_9BACL|nr:enoyl-CoA hydratase/isomerase family protein [Hazenella coriacea]TCS96441.1 enoyl-CoA hydratase/isomerase-like protein [Hazenella coriacea]